MMIKKTILAAMLTVGCVCNNVLSLENEEAQQKTVEPKVFDNQGSKVIIGGNDVLQWMENGDQTNVSPHFEKTVVVKLKKNGSYNTQFQLRSIKKALSIEPNKRSPKEQNDLHHWEKFVYAAKANNGFECPAGTIEIPDRDGNKMPIIVVFYKTQNTAHRDAYQIFLQKQEKKKVHNRVIHGQC
jgi:hypothetical protein